MQKLKDKQQRNRDRGEEIIRGFDSFLVVRAVKKKLPQTLFQKIRSLSLQNLKIEFTKI